MQQGNWFAGRLVNPRRVLDRREHAGRRVGCTTDFKALERRRSRGDHDARQRYAEGAVQTCARKSGRRVTASASCFGRSVALFGTPHPVSGGEAKEQRKKRERC